MAIPDYWSHCQIFYDPTNSFRIDRVQRSKRYYTLLSGFRLPWPPSGCLDALTPFVVSDERIFRHLNFTFGSSRIASSAYQKWPTSVGTFECPRSIK